jgi:ABC-type multidrug transport system fused ATPase/permease subunit
MYFLKVQSGEIVQRIIPEIDELGTLIAESVKVASYFLQVILLLFMISLINIMMFMISIAVLLLYAFWFYVWKHPLSISDRRVKKLGGELYSVYSELISNIKNIKLFNLHRIKSSEIDIKLDALEIATITNNIVRSVFDYGRSIFPIAILIITAYCFHQILNEKMTIGYYLVFTAILGTLMYPIDILLGFGGRLQAGIVSSTRMNEILTDDNERSGTKILESFTSEIYFENICFSFDEKEIFNNLSFKIKKGQNVAIVGGSGSGKTTIVMLLVRLYDPAKGRITIDGIPLNSYDINSLRNKIGFLSQDVFLFNDSIEENVNPNGTLDYKVVKSALAKAQMSDFIEKLDYQVGESGKKLSGGEKQRLSIARLLARNCEIIILDEAASNLDPRTTVELTKMFRELHIKNPSLTFITITHNPSSLISMDNIFVLKNGRISYEGNFEECNKNCTQFRELFNTLDSTKEADIDV